MNNQVKMINELFSYFDPKDADKKTGVCYPVDWEKVADATKVTLIPESNLDRGDPESLINDIEFVE